MARPSKIRETGNLWTVGRCVYCWPNKTVTIGLTEEHIIPRGLGGYYFLRDASCQDCQKITSSFERDVINGMFWVLRVLHNVRGKGKKHPNPPVKVRGQDGSIRVAYPPQNVIPLAVALPLFGPANLLRHHYGAASTPFAIWAKIDPQAFEEATQHGIHGMPTEIALQSFKRMLCKIAHCSIIAKLGLDFEPMLSDVILGNHADLSPFVGAQGEPYPVDPDSLHSTDFFTNGDLIVTVVQLFSTIGAPDYHVVTGRAREGQFQRNTSL